MTPSKTLLERSCFPTTSLRSFSKLRKDSTIIIHCSLWLQQETAIKKPQIMLRTAAEQKGSQHLVTGIKHLQAELDVTQLTTLLQQLPLVGKPWRVHYRVQLEMINLFFSLSALDNNCYKLAGNQTFSSMSRGTLLHSVIDCHRLNLHQNITLRDEQLITLITLWCNKCMNNTHVKLHSNFYKCK